MLIFLKFHLLKIYHGAYVHTHKPAETSKVHFTSQCMVQDELWRDYTNMQE